jgi:hypothetical protein
MYGFVMGDNANIGPMVLGRCVTTQSEKDLDKSHGRLFEHRRFETDKAGGPLYRMVSLHTICEDEFFGVLLPPASLPNNTTSEYSSLDCTECIKVKDRKLHWPNLFMQEHQSGRKRKRKNVVPATTNKQTHPKG